MQKMHPAFLTVPILAKAEAAKPYLKFDQIHTLLPSSKVRAASRDIHRSPQTIHGMDVFVVVAVFWVLFCCCFSAFLLFFFFLFFNHNTEVCVESLATASTMSNKATPQEARHGSITKESTAIQTARKKPEMDRAQLSSLLPAHAVSHDSPDKELATDADTAVASLQAK